MLLINSHFTVLINMIISLLITPKKYGILTPISRQYVKNQSMFDMVHWYATITLIFIMIDPMALRNGYHGTLPQIVTHSLAAYHNSLAAADDLVF